MQIAQCPLSTWELCMQGESPHLVELFIDTAEKARSMLPLISRRPVLTRNALAAQSMASGQDGAGLTCFSSFVAGSGSLHTSMQRTRALPFRCSLLPFNCSHCPLAALRCLLAAVNCCSQGGKACLHRFRLLMKEPALPFVFSSSRLSSADVGFVLV